MRTPYLLIPLFLTLQTKLSEEIMDSKALSSVVARFSSRFCNELDKTKSVVSSPLSAEYLLALLTLGAKDPAHTELLNSLEIPDDESIRSSFADVSSKLKSIKGITLNIANKVYLKEGPYELNPTLKEDAVRVFDASFEKCNFDDGPGSAELINKWVETKTNEKIKDLLSSDSISSDTRVVLVNALYFKGTWKNQFNPMNTMQQPFNIDSQNVVSVPMMYMEDNFKYGESEELQSQILELPYEGEEASMVIVLPRDIEGLNGILQKLADGYDLMSDLEKMFSTKVQVSLPKFKIETEIDLADVLPKLGVKAIFEPFNSGLDNILDVPTQLFVSKAVQKAFIEVNEEGAEAAAASAVVTRKRRAIMEPYVFRVDRPALWCIMVDRQTTIVAVYRPKAAPPRSDL